MENHSANIDQHFREDKSLLLTLSKLREYRIDHHSYDELHHTIRINAFKEHGKWYEIQKVPHDISSEELANQVDHIQEITAFDFIELGFQNMSGMGEDGDGLIYNPSQDVLKVSDLDFDFPFVCTHKREAKPGKTSTKFFLVKKLKDFLKVKHVLVSKPNVMTEELALMEFVNVSTLTLLNLATADVRHILSSLNFP